MNILVVCQHYWPEPYRLADVCEELAGRGHRVHVVTGVPNYPLGRIYRDYRWGRNRRQLRNGVRISRTFTIGRRKNPFFRLLNYLSFSFSSSVYAAGMEERYDVVLAYQTSPVLMAAGALVYGKKHRVPVLLYCMDLWPASLRVGGVKSDSLLYRLFHRISRWIYRRADAVAVSSRGFAGYLSREFGLDQKNLIYLPQYGDNVFPAAPAEKKDTLDLVFAGNVGAAQSIPTILEAAQLLGDQKDIRWHIIGTGSELEKNRELARQVGLDQVTFHGYLSGAELEKYYALADAMLITLTADPLICLTLPLKLLSYMASGKPIIAAADGEIAVVMAESGCGYRVPAESSRLLAEAVLRFRQDPHRREYAVRAAAYYQANFARDLFMDRLEKTLKDLAGGGGAV